MKDKLTFDAMNVEQSTIKLHNTVTVVVLSYSRSNNMYTLYVTTIIVYASGYQADDD